MNKTKILEYNKGYRELNKDKISKLKNEWFQTN